MIEGQRNVRTYVSLGKSWQHLVKRLVGNDDFVHAEQLSIGAEDATAAAKCCGYSFLAQALSAPL